MTFHQVSLRWTVSSHRCVEVGRTLHLSSSTCLVYFLTSMTTYFMSNLLSYVSACEPVQKSVQHLLKVLWYACLCVCLCRCEVSFCCNAPVEPQGTPGERLASDFISVLAKYRSHEGCCLEIRGQGKPHNSLFVFDP